MYVPKVAAIHDLSGLGKCSLTVALPILSVLGAQACPLPTAYLSNQTGYPSYYFSDFTPKMKACMAEWEKQKITFDGIYSGFLGSAHQAEILEEFIATFAREDTLILIDPVMGDGGQLYSTYTPELCSQMEALIHKATVTTPNLTEACILTGTDYNALLRQKADPGYHKVLEGMAREISSKGPEIVIITGIHETDQETGEGYIYNIGYDATVGQAFSTRNREVEGSYSGTGDIFASILCGYMCRGVSAPRAARRASHFLQVVLADTYANGTDPREGTAFENHLALLLEDIEQ